MSGSIPSLPTPSAGTAPATPSAAPVPTNPDGSPNFGALGSVPVPGGSKADIWGLSTYVLNYEKSSAANAKPFVWETPQPIKTASGFDNPRFRAANDMPSSDEAANAAALGKMFTSGEDLMKLLSAMPYSDPRQFLTVQNWLKDGPWGTIKVTGTFDKETRTALNNAMETYLQTVHGAGVPISFSQFLIDSAKSNQALNPGAGQGGASTPPSRPELTDPDTLSMYAQRAAQAALGRNLSPAEIKSFIDSFHSQQTDSFNDALHGQGAVTLKTDPRASAIQFVTSNHGQEYDQHQAQGYMDSFLNMFLSGAPSAPNMNVDPQAVSY